MIVRQIAALETELKQDKVNELNLCKFIQICLRVRSFHRQIALKILESTPNVRLLRILERF